MPTFTAQNVMELRASTGAGMMDCKEALAASNGDVESARDYLRKKGITVARKKAGRATDEGAIGMSIAEDHSKGALVRLSCETDFVSRNRQFLELLNTLAEQCLKQSAADFLNQFIAQRTVQETITEYIQTLGENINWSDATDLSAPTLGVIGGYVHTNRRIGVLVALAGNSSAAAASIARDIAMHIAAFSVQAISNTDIDAAVLDKERSILEAQFKESGKPAHLMDKVISGRMDKFMKEISLLDQPFVKDSNQSVREMLDTQGKKLGHTFKIEQFIKYQF